MRSKVMTELSQSAMGHTWMKGRSGLSEKLKVWSRCVAARPVGGHGAWEESPPASAALAILSWHPGGSACPVHTQHTPTLLQQTKDSSAATHTQRLLRVIPGPITGHGETSETLCHPMEWKALSHKVPLRRLDLPLMPDGRCHGVDEGLETQEPTGHPCGPQGYGHPCSGLHIHLGARTPPCRSRWHGGPPCSQEWLPHQALLLETGKESSPALVLDFLLMYVTTEDLLLPGTSHEAQITAHKVMTWESCSPTQAVFSRSPQSQWMTKHSTFLFHLKGDVNWH